jgi:hypothetical protein
LHRRRIAAFKAGDLVWKLPAFAGVYGGEEHAMTKQQMPPVPAEQRSPKGPGCDPKGPGCDPKFSQADEIPNRENFDEQGRQGNIKQNTHNQGYQQDR